MASGSNPLELRVGTSCPVAFFLLWWRLRMTSTMISTSTAMPTMVQPMINAVLSVLSSAREAWIRSRAVGTEVGICVGVPVGSVVVGVLVGAKVSFSSVGARELGAIDGLGVFGERVGPVVIASVVAWTLLMGALVGSPPSVMLGLLLDAKSATTAA